MSTTTISIGLGARIHLRIDVKETTDRVIVGIKKKASPSTEVKYDYPCAEITLLPDPLDGFAQAFDFLSPPMNVSGLFEVEIATRFGVVIEDSKKKTLIYAVIPADNSTINEEVIT
jgi:hypothetical protein